MIELVREYGNGVTEYSCQVFGDDRGRFLELGRTSELRRLGLPPFAQLNVSESSRGVLRGLHYQLPPSPQGKLVTVLSGRVWDVGVDLRRSSPTFGEWVGVELDAESANLLYIPEGFGHGFVAMSDRAIVLYRATSEYDQPSERSLAYDDPTIGIEWPDIEGDVVVSPKDRDAPRLEDADLFA